MQLTSYFTGPVLHIFFHRQAPLLMFVQRPVTLQISEQTTLFFSRLQVYLKRVFVGFFFQVNSQVTYTSYIPIIKAVYNPDSSPQTTLIASRAPAFTTKSLRGNSYLSFISRTLIVLPEIPVSAPLDETFLSSLPSGLHLSWPRLLLCHLLQTGLCNPLFSLLQFSAKT